MPQRGGLATDQEIGSFTSIIQSHSLWCCGVMVIFTEQLHSTKSELRFCAGTNPAPGTSGIRNGENLWQWFQLEIRINTFRHSTIPQPFRHHSMWIPAHYVVRPNGHWELRHKYGFGHSTYELTSYHSVTLNSHSVSKFEFIVNLWKYPKWSESKAELTANSG